LIDNFFCCLQGNRGGADSDDQISPAVQGRCRRSLLLHHNLKWANHAEANLQGVENSQQRRAQAVAISAAVLLGQGNCTVGCDRTQHSPRRLPHEGLLSGRHNESGGKDARQVAAIGRGPRRRNTRSDGIHRVMLMCEFLPQRRLERLGLAVVWWRHFQFRVCGCWWSERLGV
jgi:hypothetical protein